MSEIEVKQKLENKQAIGTPERFVEATIAVEVIRGPITGLGPATAKQLENRMRTAQRKRSKERARQELVRAGLLKEG